MNTDCDSFIHVKSTKYYCLVSDVEVQTGCHSGRCHGENWETGDMPAVRDRLYYITDIISVNKFLCFKYSLAWYCHHWVVTVTEFTNHCFLENQWPIFWGRPLCHFIYRSVIINMLILTLVYIKQCLKMHQSTKYNDCKTTPKVALYLGQNPKTCH